MRHTLRVSGKPLSTLLHAQNAVGQRWQSLESDSWVPHSALPLTSPVTLVPDGLNLLGLQCPCNEVVSSLLVVAGIK